MPFKQRVRVLALPVFRRHWMFHGTVDSADQERVLLQAGNWMRAGRWDHRVALLQQRLSQWWSALVQKRIRELRDAKERSLKNRTYRLIQAVLSREHPSETFLKSIPRSGKVLFHVEYPSSVPERLVRRRLRALARLQSYHARMRAIYGMTTLLLSPLLLAPIPLSNLPVFYLVYRLQSHHMALGGAKVLQSSFDAYDIEHLESRPLQECQGAISATERGSEKSSSCWPAPDTSAPAPPTNFSPWGMPPGWVYHMTVHRNAVPARPVALSSSEGSRGEPKAGLRVGSMAEARDERRGVGPSWMERLEREVAESSGGRALGVDDYVAKAKAGVDRVGSRVGEYVEWARGGARAVGGTVESYVGWARGGVKELRRQRRRKEREVWAAVDHTLEKAEERILAVLPENVRTRTGVVGGRGAPGQAPQGSSELFEALEKWRGGSEADLLPEAPCFRPLAKLSEALESESLSEFPLQDQTAYRIGKEFQTRGLMEAVARARLRYSGAFIYSKIDV